MSNICASSVQAGHLTAGQIDVYEQRLTEIEQLDEYTISQHEWAR